jgi:hypothetical protein
MTFMVRREILLDEETDRMLAAIAEGYAGDVNQALADLVRTREGLEDMAAQSEEAHRDSLVQQRDRAERAFREGRSTPWDEVRRKNRL